MAGNFGNFGDAMKLMQAWNVFKANHPKFPAFLSAAKNMGISEGTVLALTITSPDGQKIETNVRVTESDLQLFESLKGLH